MTNKEYVLEKYSTELLDIIPEYDVCPFCNLIGCRDFCNNTPCSVSCEETFNKWLNMEHIEPLAFPIGTIVEVTSDESTWIGYYNGVRAPGVHKVCTYKENIGKKDGSIPQGSSVTLDQVKKVGDYECNK